MSVLEGTTLGRYHLKRLLGQGGMAEVYLASDEQLHRDVAVKVVHLSRVDDLARFRREAELLGPLTHEHILPVFDYGEQGSWHYLVMPYMSYGTLSDRLKVKGPLSQEEAGLLLKQIASALQYAHDRGILHRDIKPSNILLRDDTYAYVAYFGIAKALDQESDLTQAGTVIGTPEYMAPELLEQSASPGSDIYALGILLYYMLTGHVPFTGPTSLAILQKQVSTPPVPPSQLNPAISLPVEHVILGALEKDPQRRFHTPQALAHAYQQALQQSHVPVPAPQSFQSGHAFYTSPTIAITPSSPRPAPSHSGVRRPATFIVVGALGLLLLLAVVLWSGALLMGIGNHPVSQTPVTHVPTAPPPTLAPSPTATSASCTVTDTAHVLDQAQVCQAAQTLSYPVTVYTTNTVLNGDGDFNRLSQSLVTSPQMIAIAINIDTSHSHPRVHINIVGGTEVSLTDSQYHRAMEIFNSVANTRN